MAVVLRMPEVATGTGEAAIASWLVSVGDAVVIGQTIAEIETEKAVVEYEAESAGTVAATVADAGDAVAVGAPIVVLAEAGETAEAALSSVAELIGSSASPEVQPVAAEVVTAPVAVEAAAAAVPIDEVSEGAEEEKGNPGDGERLFASPLVRRLARERGIDLAELSGSGPRGRIVRRDLDALASAQAEVQAQVKPVAQTPAPSGGGASGRDDVELVPHTGMRRAIARRLTESKVTIPHFYLVSHCRVDDLLALRAQVNAQAQVKVSINDFIVKAVAAALHEVPEANAIWTEAGVERYRDVDLAVAVSIPGGLLTPVVRGAHTLTLTALSARIRDLAERAREGKLKQQELEGGSFSVSNLGMYGTEEFTAVINPPHSGILAVGAIVRRPVVVEDRIEPASVLTVTLSADHRVVDGAVAAQWLAAFTARIENPLSLLI